jgi:hypothetical protein
MNGISLLRPALKVLPPRALYLDGHFAVNSVVVIEPRTDREMPNTGLIIITTISQILLCSRILQTIVNRFLYDSKRNDVSTNIGILDGELEEDHVDLVLQQSRS